MLNDAEIIARLREVLEPADLSAAVKRIRLVHEAWSALGDEEFLSYLLEHPEEINWSPASIADSCLMFKRPPSQDGDNWDAHRSQAVETLFRLAKDSHEMAARINQSPQGSLEELASPSAWASRLCVAWPHIDQQTSFSEQMLATRDESKIKLLLTIIRANYPDGELLEKLGGVVGIVHAAPVLMNQGDRELANFLLDYASEHDDGETRLPGAAELKLDAFAQALSGDFKAAHASLSSAWDSATEATAKVADQLADIARLEGNQAVELEARKKAVAASGNPIRRATMARSLIEHGQAYDASLLVTQAESIEERIAHGMAALDQGLIEQARGTLTQVSQEALALDYADQTWLGWLTTGLEACGAMGEAIGVKTRLAHLLPHNIDIEMELANLYERAGDPSGAVSHAEIAMAIAPDSSAARKSLAHHLRNDDQPGRALGYLKQVVEDDENALVEYCECALEADEPELAGEIASKLAAQHPDSAWVHTLLARAELLQGRHEGAKSAIERAITLDPDQADPYLILAELQVSSGDPDVAGDSIQKAIQIDPENPQAHYARSRWLIKRDRFHEANEHIAKAVELHPTNVSCLIEHADLLTRVGDPADARLQLERALDLQPRNWQVRQKLAFNLEQAGEVEQAVQLIEDLPNGIDDAARIRAGRLLVKHGLSGNPEALKQGHALLTTSESTDTDRADHLYWSGTACEALGDFEQASLHYEAYLGQYEHITEHYTLEAVLGYGRVSLELGKPEQAISFLDLNRDRFPGSMDIIRLLADSHLQLGDSQEAYRIATAALEHNPASVEAHRLVSITAEESGDIRTAIDAEQFILEHQPEVSANWGRIAKLYASIKEIPAARDHLAHAIFIDRQNPGALHRLAKVTGELGMAATQMRLMERAGSLAPSNADLNQELAELAEQKGDYETAYSAWSRCLDANPGELMLLRKTASAVSKAGHSSTAIELWQQIIDQVPEDEQSLFSLAGAYEARGDLQSSLQHFERLLEAGVQDADILTACARAMLEYGDFGKAKSVIDRTLHQHPEQPGIQLVQSEALLRTGDATKALDIVEGLIAKSYGDAYVLALASLCAVMTGDIQRAKSGLDEALREPHFPPKTAIILMEVCAAIGEWRIYDTLINALKADIGQNMMEARQALAAVLRARDLVWLHREQFNVQRNIPSEEHVTQWLDAWNERALAAGEDGAEHPKALDQWHEIFDNPAPIVETGFAQLTHDEIQLFVQSAAMSLIHSNRPAKALDMLEENLPTGIHRGYHALLTSLAALKSDQNARAKDAAEISSNFVETRACGSYLMGRIAIIESDLQAAITAINTALSIWPDEAYWHAELARIYTQSERKEAALPHLQQAVELDPQNPEHLLALARSYRAAGELSQAESTYAQCLQEDSPSAQVWKEAGEVALANGHASQAESWFEKACGLAPSDALCLMGSARAAMLLGQNKHALQRAQSAYKLAPNEPEVLTGYGEILAGQGKTEKALQAYDRAIKISAGDPHIQLARSRLLMKSGQYSDAINDILAVVEVKQDPEAWALLAEAYEQAAQMDKALEAINQALNHAPRSGTYRFQQGRIYRKTGQLDQALNILRELERDEPGIPGLAGELGKVYEDRRETDAALEAYLRAVALDRKDTESGMQAGLILKGLKSYEQAAEMFELVVASRPNDAKALHQLAAVRALQLVHGGIDPQVVTT